MKANAASIIVAGAGIVGAALARSLVREGFRVTVVDRGPVGGGATAAGMGHLVVMDDSPAQLALTNYSQQLWRELAPALPGEMEFTRTGTIWVAADEEEWEEVHRKHALLERHGLISEILPPSDLQRLEPNLRGGLRGGLLVPGDCVLYPPTAAYWLLDQAVKDGAEVYIGQAIKELTGRWVRMADESVLKADFVINALGAGAGQLTKNLPLRPRKGHLVITDRHPGFVHHQLLELGYLKSAHSSEGDSVAFNVQPRATGQLLIGSSRQFGADDSTVDFKILNKMVERALAYMPKLASVSAIRVWTGFRAATPDSLPLIGPLPEDPQLLLATGHEGLGITTSLATAAILTDHLLNRKPAIDPEQYLPARLAMAVAHE